MLYGHGHWNTELRVLVFFKWLKLVKIARSINVYRNKVKQTKEGYPVFNTDDWEFTNNKEK